MAEQTIPVIDVSDAVSGHDPARVAHELGEAVRTIGFLQIVGHGIDPGEFHRVHDAAGDLWAASPAEMDQWASPIGHRFRGVTYELDDHGNARRQGLQNNRYLTADDALADGVPAEFADFFGGNAFPPMPALATAYWDLFARTRALGRLIIGLFALELGIGIDGF